jgi:branched-chain amino acid transport system ATP-binding protein
MILEARQLKANYGASQILFGIDFELEKSETVCILGRNGVGKTTTMKTLMGLLKPAGGSVRFNGLDIGGMAPYRISRLGIAYVPQGRQIFPNLTTRENLLIAARKGKGEALDWTIQSIYEIFPVLKNREGFRGGSLSGGEQQMLSIGRGLMQNPRLLLMDEIFEGLAPLVIQEIMKVVKRLEESGISILISEQSIKFAREIGGRCYVLEKGQVVYSGNTVELSEEIVVKYLGT